MTEEEYQILRPTRKHSTIPISSLKNIKPRTLLYGYDLDRNSVHLYCIDSLFTYVQYNRQGTVLEHKDMYEIPIDIGLGVNKCYYVPNKRVYWDKSDFEFCKLLKEQGVTIPFTNSYGSVLPQQFYGKTLAQLTKGD